MNRRAFNACVVGTFGALLTEPLPLPARPRGSPDVNGARLLTHLLALAEFGTNPEGGVSHVAFSEADWAGWKYVMGLMRTAKLDVRVDAAGTIPGSHDGGEPSLVPLVFGSHIDSVPEAGNYDGTVGRRSWMTPYSARLGPSSSGSGAWGPAEYVSRCRNLGPG